MPSLPDAPRLDAAVRERFGSARLAHLATADEDGRPHLVPIVFAFTDGIVYSAVDTKPKRHMALRRLANVMVNPLVSILVDHYDDSDWTQLWWVRADGLGRVIDPDDDEARKAVQLLGARYPQHRLEPPPGPVLAVDVQSWTSWSASKGAG